MKIKYVYILIDPQGAIYRLYSSLSKFLYDYPYYSDLRSDINISLFYEGSYRFEGYMLVKRLLC